MAHSLFEYPYYLTIIFVMCLHNFLLLNFVDSIDQILLDLVYFLF
jgi:hypothetical protein